MTKAQYLRPERTIKRGKATYRYHQSFDTRPAADFAAHYAVKGTGCDYHIVTEAITKPQSRIEKLVLGTVPVQHVYHTYLADGHRTGGRR
jgi:hypothetical protein